MMCETILCGDLRRFQLEPAETVTNQNYCFSSLPSPGHFTPLVASIGDESCS